MTAADVVNPPPAIAIVNYAPIIGVVLGVLLTCALLAFAKRFDPTFGTLTISLLIVLGMIGAVAYCLIFTIPNDDITPGVVGGLTAGFGAVVAYWLGHKGGGANGAVQPPEPAKGPPPGQG